MRQLVLMLEFILLMRWALSYIEIKDWDRTIDRYTIVMAGFGLLTSLPKLIVEVLG